MRAAGRRRELIAELPSESEYRDRESGTLFKPVSAVLPLAPSPSRLAWSVENLRLCGCVREQLVQKDLNDCPYCDRRMPALERSSDAG